MKLIELHIIQFGKFSDYKLSLADGFNVVEGDNESGKSTLQAFIKYVFYGLPRKNPNVLIGERERALSWLGQLAAGSVTLEDGGKKYRIERSGRTGARGAYGESCRIIDLSNGFEVFEGEVPGELFFGIDATAYDSICNVRQLECSSIDGGAVKNAIENMLSSGDENTSVKTAYKLLEAERKRLLHKSGRGGLIYETEKKVASLETEHAEAIRLEGENVRQSEELERVERKLKAAQEKYDISCSRCDLFEDAARLERFARLAELKEEAAALSEAERALNEKYGAGRKRPTHTDIAEMKTASDSLTRSKAAFDSAKAEKEELEKKAPESSVEISQETLSLLREFGSAKNLAQNLKTKAQKRMRLLAFAALFFVLSGVLLAGALALAITNAELLAGALTVAFFGICSAAVGVALFSRAKMILTSLKAMIARIGDGLSEKDIRLISERLLAVEEAVRDQEKNAATSGSARARFDLAKENYDSALINAKAILDGFGALYSDGNEADALSSLSETLRAYMSESERLGSAIKEKELLVRSLSSELERYSEKDIAKKITPEIKEAIKDSSFERLQAERNADLNKISGLNNLKATLERQLGGLESGRRSPNEVYPELEKQRKLLSELKLRFDAIIMAWTKLEEASQKLKSEVTPRIKGVAEKNMSSLTGGKYSEMFLDENVSLTVLAGGETRPIEALSKGSCDSAYLSVRLALLEIMCGDKTPPIFLDEALSQLDDGRASNAISAVVKYCDNGGQSVLFTCQKRDAILASEITDVNLIKI